MIVGVTGSKGFIGKNVVSALSDKHEIIEFEGDLKKIEDVRNFYSRVQKVIHLGGKNRGEEQELFLTNTLAAYNIHDCIKEFRKPTVLAGSNYSKPSAYSRSKHISDLLFNEIKSSHPVINYKLPNIIGVGCKPYYNSFVCTLCYLAAKKEPYTHLIRDKGEKMTLLDVEVLVNDIRQFVEDPSHILFYKNISGGERWFSEQQTINITFEEICEILENRQHSSHNKKEVFLRMIKAYETQHFENK